MQTTKTKEKQKNKSTGRLDRYFIFYEIIKVRNEKLKKKDTTFQAKWKNTSKRQWMNI